MLNASTQQRHHSSCLFESGCNGAEQKEKKR